MPSIKDDPKRAPILSMLVEAYWMEIETVQSYLANSVNLDGVRAQEIKTALAEDVTEELGHARKFAHRIKELYGAVPGSMQFKPRQKLLQPPDDSTDVAAVIRGVIDAERGGIDHYVKIVRLCEGVDYVTQDMVTAILADEEKHLRLFEGFLKEYERK